MNSTKRSDRPRSSSRPAPARVSARAFAVHRHSLIEVEPSALLRSSAPASSRTHDPVPRLELDIGDLTEERTEAVVSPSDATLVGGGLVNMALHRVAGPGLARACRAYLDTQPEALIPGDVVVTPGYRLPSRFVLHSVAEAFSADSARSAESLTRCFRRILELAREEEFDSVSFPAFGIGAFGYPIREAAPVAVASVLDELRRAGAPRLVRFVLFGPSLYEAYLDAVLEQVVGGAASSSRRLTSTGS